MTKVKLFFKDLLLYKWGNLCQNVIIAVVTHQCSGVQPLRSPAGNLSVRTYEDTTVVGGIEAVFTESPRELSECSVCAFADLNRSRKELQGCVVSGGSMRESIFLLFPVSRSWLHPQLMVPSSLGKVSLVLALGVSSPSLTLTYLPPSSKDDRGYSGPIWIIQDNLSIQNY